jgi:hypothetical protein
MQTSPKLLIRGPQSDRSSSLEETVQDFGELPRPSRASHPLAPLALQERPHTARRKYKLRRQHAYVVLLPVRDADQEKPDAIIAGRAAGTVPNLAFNVCMNLNHHTRR